jgi:hypothetical protein
MNIFSIIKLKLLFVIGFMLSTNAWATGLSEANPETNQVAVTVSNTFAITYDSSENKMSIGATGADALAVKLGSNDADGFDATVTATSGVFKIDGSSTTDSKFEYTLACDALNGNLSGSQAVAAKGATDLATDAVTIWSYTYSSTHGGIFQDVNCDIAITDANLSKVKEGTYIETLTFAIAGKS